MYCPLTEHIMSLITNRLDVLFYLGVFFEIIIIGIVGENFLSPCQPFDLVASVQERFSAALSSLLLEAKPETVVVVGVVVGQDSFHFCRAVLPQLLVHDSPPLCIARPGFPQLQCLAPPADLRCSATSPGTGHGSGVTEVVSHSVDTC